MDLKSLVLPVVVPVACVISSCYYLYPYFKDKIGNKTKNSTIQNQHIKVVNMAEGSIPSNVTTDSFNFLILGETGVGKTTFINSFANYQLYPTIDVALTSELHAVISASFNITDTNNESQTIYVGEKDESKVDGQSDTQDCKAYLFQNEGRIIRLIDTPGIGDTRGLEKDRENSQKILAFVSHYPKVHGILIMLKPNHARLSPNFRFCILEILCYLHNSACDNIVFVFTNSRGTSYKAGDTITPLKLLLKEIKLKNSNVDIPLTKDRTYYLDNEGFRFLAAVKNDIKFDEEEIEDFGRSWKKSTVECARLIEYIVKLVPHDIVDSLSVNDARRMIVGFSRPLADITHNISLNLVVVAEQKIKIKMAGHDSNKLKGKMRVPTVELMPVPYEKPITVCTTKKCIKVYNSNGIDHIDYVQKCHKPCHLQNVTPNLLKNPDLRHCAAMQGKHCQRCGCPWQEHMHIYYENVVTLKEGEEKQCSTTDVNSTEKIIAMANGIITELDKQRNVLEGEQETITRVSARFAHFLEKNAITAYNDAVEDYLGHLIEGEKTKQDQGGTRTEMLQQMEKMKEAYLKEKELLAEKIGSNGYTDDAISPKEIWKDCQLLFNLPFNGPTIKKMVMEFEDATRKEHENFTEVAFDATLLFGKTAEKPPTPTK